MTEDNENGCYSTGELARACGVTVRTVQHYDSKGLLSPSGYSGGGRRLYTEEDADRLRFILMLKSLGLKLAQIKGVLESTHNETLLQMLLDEQEVHLQAEIAERSARLAAIKAIRADISDAGKLTLTTEAAVADRMENERARKRWLATMVILGTVMDVLWIGTLVLGIVTGVWWPFPLGLLLAVAIGVWVFRFYGNHSTYLCPACHAEFRPTTAQYFFSKHTPKTRKLTCPCCLEKDWCVERYYAQSPDLAPGECVPGTCTRGGYVAEGGDAR